MEHRRSEAKRWRKRAPRMFRPKTAANTSDRVELSVNRAKIDQLTSTLLRWSSQCGKIESIRAVLLTEPTMSVVSGAEKMLQSIGLLKAGKDEMNDRIDCLIESLRKRDAAGKLCCSLMMNEVISLTLILSALS
jgi:hypothetical protein